MGWGGVGRQRSGKERGGVLSSLLHAYERPSLLRQLDSLLGSLRITMSMCLYLGILGCRVCGFRVSLKVHLNPKTLGYRCQAALVPKHCSLMRSP